MEDALKCQIHSLLDTIKEQIKTNKKCRSELVTQTSLDYLVGVVEFQDFSAMMVIKLLLEYQTQDFTFIWNRNLTRCIDYRYIYYNDNSLEIVARRTKNKVRSFLRFLRRLKSNLPSFLRKLRRGWVRIVEVGFVSYLRKNVYLSHKNISSFHHPGFEAIKDSYRGEDLFWRHALILTNLIPENYQAELDNTGILKISHGNASDGSLWNYIFVTSNYQLYIEDELDIIPSKDGKTVEDIVGKCEIIV